MINLPPSGLTGTSGPSLVQLDARARDIFRRVVETYLETGDPVGSRTVSRGGVQLSPASIRNTMQDLTQLGLLAAPHTSAGRVPTHAGLRLFVDGLLELGDITQEERLQMEERLAGRSRGLEEALGEATALLSGLAGGAGVVVTPSRDAGVKHVEFVALGADQTLVVMVFDDGTVENRLMRRPPGLTPSALQEASNFLNAMLRGRSNLLDDHAAVEDLELVRLLFDDLEQKEQLIGLLDDVREAQGVRIFIGAETRLFSLSGSAVIAAPYMTERRRVLGAIGVIGPTRLNYARVIPLVDYTARLLGRLLDS